VKENISISSNRKVKIISGYSGASAGSCNGAWRYQPNGMASSE
jgi:hypothetical protein